MNQSQTDSASVPDWCQSPPDSMEQAVADFLEYGVSFLPLGRRHAVDELIESVDEGFGELLRQCDKEALTPAYRHEPGNDVDSGLIRRRGGAVTDGEYDFKDYFHFRMNALDRVDFQRWRPWLSQCAAIMERCRARVGDFLRTLDQALPGYHLADQICTPATTNDEVLRVIHYRMTRPGTETIARRHRGRAGIVLALWESYPGLRADIAGEWRPLGSIPGHPMIFAGQRLVQLTAGEVTALDHRVDHVRGAETVRRRSMVAFFDPHNVAVSLPTH